MGGERVVPGSGKPAEGFGIVETVVGHHAHPELLLKQRDNLAEVRFQ